MAGILWIEFEEGLGINPVHGVVPSPHHVTLAYGVDRAVVADYIDIPTAVMLNYEKRGNDSQVIACTLQGEASQVFQGQWPHITVSHSVHVKPYESNKFLTVGEGVTTILNRVISGVICFKEWE